MSSVPARDGVTTGVRTRGRVVIAEDDVLMREGIVGVLDRAGFEVVGQAGDGLELLAAVREQRPDIAVVDIRMPPGHLIEGLEAAQVIRRELPEVGILVLSAHVEVADAIELLAGGHRIGYLLKSRVSRVVDFVDAVERVLDGGAVVDPELVRELVDARRRDSRLARLTDRERDVLGLMAEGLSNAGIARRLFVTEGTVEKHVRSILAKLCLPEAEDDHRRVLAVLAYLEAR